MRCCSSWRCFLRVSTDTHAFSLSLFEYYKERRRKNRNEEGQNIRKTKKKSRVDRLVFNFLWVFCRLYAIIVVAYFTSSQLVCVCVCVCYMSLCMSLFILCC